MSDIAVTPNVGSAAVALRITGASFADIALTLGLRDARSAIRAVHNELAERADQDTESRDALRRMESSRLDSLLESVWGKAHDPDHGEHLPAIRTAMAIIDRRIRLYGLDAPSEVIVHTPTQGELDAWVAHMAQQSMPALDEPDIIDVESSIR